MEEKDNKINNKIDNEMQKELAHFNMCLSIIRDNISKYEIEFQSIHLQVQELYKVVNSKDTELYYQLMTNISLEEHAANSLRKNKAALEKPYFGRIDYIDLKLNQKECIYIGKNGVFQNKTDVLIADWRAPISSVYYENELGIGEFGLPDESKIPIDLKNKRTFDVDNGKLKGYYDSDVTSNDDLLVKYLSKNKDAVLGEIIATIQKEQNAIIRESPYANLIVQGVAGSGKTTVALHRISYLLYNYKQRFEANEYCIIGSNDLLLNYITSSLPELDVPKMKYMRMDQLLIRLCEKDWIKKLCIIPEDETAPLRCTLLFMQELELFLMHKREEILDASPLIDNEIGTIITQSSTLTLFQENPQFSIFRLLSSLDERVKTRIKFLMNEEEKEKIQIKLRQYAKYYKNLRPKASIFDFYQEFLMQWAEKHNFLQDSSNTNAVNNHLASCYNKQYDLYDIAALALIHYRIRQTAPNEEFSLLFLDEAQDFGISIYYVLKTLLPSTYFTIMGDVSQNINYNTGINDWYELTKLFLTSPKDKFLMLQKSYRNTIEISNYAGKILEKASFGRYKITPVIRHGIPVQEKTFANQTEIAKYIIELIPEIRSKGYPTTAIICFSEEKVQEVKLLLKDHISLSDKEAENFTIGTMLLSVKFVKGLEFDTVILWNPDFKNGLQQPNQAKLFYVAATRALHELYVFYS